jgi:hypothetical protein
MNTQISNEENYEHQRNQGEPDSSIMLTSAAKFRLTNFDSVVVRIYRQFGASPPHPFMMQIIYYVMR